jgi:hypothetical protein
VFATASKLPKITLHGTRHSWATLALLTTVGVVNARSASSYPSSSSTLSRTAAIWQHHHAITTVNQTRGTPNQPNSRPERGMLLVVGL